MEENINTQVNQPKPINFQEIWQKILKVKKLYFTILPAALIGTYLLTLFVPRYYSCDVELAPESSDNSSLSSLTSLASSFGLEGLENMSSNGDAINVLLYPDLFKSPNLIVTLFPIKVTTKEGETYTYYDYILNHQKYPIWEEYILMPLHQMMAPDVSFLNGNVKNGSNNINLRNLSKEQNNVIGIISQKLKCSIDKKTYAATITVEDQDPVVCALLADSVMGRLQMFITDYRTKKARIDYNYYKQLTMEAKEQYERARRLYAGSTDADMDVIMESVKAKQEDLENDMQLKYNLYTAMNTRLESSRAKVQEYTPAFTTLKSATIPIKPAGPRRMIISVAMMILAFFGVTVYGLFIKK